ncbi:MAG: hypothetical protein E5X15_30695, partial [Mesorhizobium sp.]
LGGLHHISEAVQGRTLPSDRQRLLNQYACVQRWQVVARHGKLPPRRHEELPPQWIAEERANERTTNHGKPVVE